VNINATIIGQAITFAILIWFTLKFVWPPVTAALEERAQKIADGLAAAERAKADLSLAERKSADAMVEARQKAAEIIAMSEKRRAEIVEEAKHEAIAEADRIKAAAKAEVEQEAYRAREALRAQVASLAVAGAERILRREINAEVHADLLTALSAEL
jgi:F-type H+-transporting ATPase subunit b